ncbi:MAG: hypothetical protein Q4D61_04405, partial [Cardiobacteriaceae bacterium]|nr:hypothetical protein [Cardiobacteriaceae bacterium]
MDQSRLKAYFSKKKAELTTLSQKYWNQLLAKPRHEQLLWVFAIEVALAIIFFVPLMVLASSFTIIEKILTTTGVWTLITVLISSPIAFFVWKFRDENTIHQLENQRKDVNLKEFQKIAEWVSGLHLVEDKIVKKTKSTEKAAGNHPSGQEQKTDGTPEMETSHEYGQAGQSRHIPSHSRQDGAVGLQVAAVYMLKPFYCGEHGEGFRKPALNLLTSAWLALFKQLEKDKKNQPTHQQLYPELLSNSPLAIALTEVLLADGGTHLRHHREVFPNLYLPYLNLHLPGLDKEEVLQLFVGLKCRGINLE